MGRMGPIMPFENRSEELSTEDGLKVDPIDETTFVSNNTDQNVDAFEAYNEENEDYDKVQNTETQPSSSSAMKIWDFDYEEEFHLDLNNLGVTINYNYDEASKELRYQLKRPKNSIADKVCKENTYCF